MPSSIDFSAVFDASANAYMLLDRELRFVAANRAYRTLTGSRLEDLVGRHVIEAFPNDPENPENENARILRESLARVVASGRPDEIAFLRYRVAEAPGGALRERAWSATHTPVFDAEGRVAFVLQHTVDVTHALESGGSSKDPTATAAQVEATVLRRAERVQDENRSLDEELRFMRSLFEQAPGFTCVLRGPRHVFALCNAAYYNIVGRHALLGRTVAEALPEVVDQGFVALLDRVYATGVAYVGRDVSLTLQRSSGGPATVVWLDFVYQPVLDHKGRVTGIFVQGHDVTEQHRLEAERAALLEAECAARAEAERANRINDELLATVSHELRTPLTGLLGWVQMLRSGQLKPDRWERALDAIERNARTQAQLVDDILDVSRIISGKLRIDVAPVRLGDIVEAATEAVRPAADARDVRILCTVDTSAYVMGDAGRLQQIVWNLLANAVRFTPKAGHVRVLVERRESSIELTVADNGMGISADFLPHIFERFRQAEGGITRRHGGLGLGLAIVKHLTEVHGGTIVAESDGPGHGATFVLRLPVAPARRRSEPDPPPRGGALFVPPKELENLHVLLVDDEPDTRGFLAEALASCGAIVRTAASVPEALNAVHESAPDVLVSDIGMPGEDGYSLVRALRASPVPSLRRLSAIALTAFARTEDRTQALRAGFNAHVPKPVDLGELFAVLATIASSRA